ncbi:rod shape-determining protein [Ramlibacter sp. XY19]|uniref:rod shape-determining protein n=1 Tax=Ramlibacter paludis TaxID=2908000 RepID=UPI0023DC735F|nr:rod shape-determining protein [Ramlibacter paludis]MCG2595389.1 rod shape-determining protein [Ramlibacter paludis]
MATLIYVQVSPHRLTLRNAKSGESVTTSPEIALAKGRKPKVVAVGAKARKQESRNVQVLNPFAHPRTLLADFGAAELLLRTLMAQVKGSRSLFGGPRVVMHLQDDPAGGFTQLEIRGFQELAKGAGASQAVVWQGPNLTDEQLKSGVFPKEGRVLS